MMTLLYLAAFVVILSIVVVVHEGGHFLVARLSGVQVTAFSVGFGPKLLSWKDKHNTEWKICAVPLGGYVQMLGDEDAASMGKSLEDSPTSLFLKTIGFKVADEKEDICVMEKVCKLEDQLDRDDISLHQVEWRKKVIKNK